jgi:ATP-dependent RNA helicase DOB1
MMSRRVVLCCRAIVTGKLLPLLSRFRLSYYTLLNILRRLEGSGQSMEYVIARSFQQFQFEQSLPQVQLLS